MDFVVGLSTSPKKKKKKKKCYLGDSGSIEKIYSFSSNKNQLFTSEACWGIYSQDSEATWYAYVHYVELRSLLHFKILEAVTRIFEYEVEFQHNFSSSIWRPIRTCYSSTKRYASSLYHWIWIWSKCYLPLVEFVYNNNF